MTEDTKDVNGAPLVKMIHPNPPNGAPPAIYVSSDPEILRQHKRLGWVADPEQESIAIYKAIEAKIAAEAPKETFPQFTPVATEKRETINTLSKPKFNK
jgi:hypothetical protein